MRETDIQALVRLEAARQGWFIHRNNVGALLDSRGVPVRYGLANDSRALNSRVKSGDLIGARPVLITPAMVGTVIGQFASIECKRAGWRFNPNDDHEVAQMRWAELVILHGGWARFVTGPEELLVP